MARPTFKPTQVMRRKVANAAAGGMPHEEIALALDISRGTLLKYFGKELKTVACAKRLEVLDAVFRQAKRGNVAAAKFFLAGGAQPVGVARPGKGAEATEPAPPKLGKKDQARADADAEVGGEWGELLPPNVTRFPVAGR